MVCGFKMKLKYIKTRKGLLRIIRFKDNVIFTLLEGGLKNERNRNKRIVKRYDRNR